MKIPVEITQYLPQKGLQLNWVDGFIIDTNIENGAIIIRANREGLISLAQHLLTLAQIEVESGNHIHFDDNNSLEEGASELIIEKI